MDEKKTEIARAMMNVEYYPAILEKDISIEKYTKLPLAKVSALGVAFESSIHHTQQSLIELFPDHTKCDYYF